MQRLFLHAGAATEIANGGVFEATFVGVTLKVSVDSGCFAIGYGKELVGGGPRL